MKLTNFRFYLYRDYNIANNNKLYYLQNPLVINITFEEYYFIIGKFFKISKDDWSDEFAYKTADKEFSVYNVTYL